MQDLHPENHSLLLRGGRGPNKHRQTAFTVLCVFYKLQACGSPASSKSVTARFATALAHFVSVSHVGILLSQCLKLFRYYHICYGDLWSGIFVKAHDGERCLAIRWFLIQVVRCFFRQNAIAHFIDYRTG